MAQRQRYGKYDVVGKLGVGGMGIVYKGYDPLIDRYVAVKTMSIDKGADENLKARFYREAQSAGMLNHPNIVTIFDMDEEGGQPYIAMELLSGVDLKEIIKKKAHLPLIKKVDIIAQSCDGLDFAHKHGVVHRDIKPGNIRLLDNGIVKILDFGIARIESSELTKTGMVMGTVSYMSPEQIAGKRVDGRSDIFSIGVVLYELITGSKPFPGPAITTILYKIMNEAPRSLTLTGGEPIPAPVEAILGRALEKDLNGRYQSAAEMAEDLRRFGESVQSLEDTQANVDATLLAGPSQTAAATIPESMARVRSRTLRGIGRTGSRRPPAAVKSPPTAIKSPPAAPASTAAQSPPTAVKSPPTAVKSPPTAPMPTATAPNPSALPPKAPPISDVTAVAPAMAADADQMRPPTLAALESTLQQEAARKTSHAPLAAILIVVFLLLAGALLLLFTVLRWQKAEPAPVAAQNGTIIIDIHPWARVESIRNRADGKPISIGSVVSPCRLSLPPGSYDFTFVNQNFEVPLKTVVDVRPGQSSTVQGSLPGFQIDKVLESL